MDSELKIRMAAPGDAGALLEIYRPYVLETAVSFDYECPTEAQFREKIQRTLETYPYLTAEKGGELLGYAYVSPFKARPAYDWAVETTIYLRRNQKGKGYGRQLYLTLEEILRRQNILNANACIAYTDNEDSTITNASMHFHEHMGYRLVGRFEKCGYKFHRWYDMIWMEKLLGPHDSPASPVIPISRLELNMEEIQAAIK